MGSGKTEVGRRVAERAQVRFYDLDRMVEQEAGMLIVEIFATQGESAFRAQETQALPRALQPESVVALGGGVVIDDGNWNLIVRTATTVYLEAAFGVIWERIRDQSGRPLLMNRTRSEIESLYQRRLARYQQAEHRVDATQDVEAVADEVLKLWSG